MRWHSYLAIVLFFAALPALAQSGPGLQTVDLRPGIYLEFDDFVNNDPIVLKENLQEPNAEQDYYELLDDGMLAVHLGDSVYEIDPRELWGFADERSVYVNKLALPSRLIDITDDAKVPWIRMNIIGAICLVHYIPYMSERVVHHPGTAMGSSGLRFRPAQYILNTKDGYFYKPTLDNLAEIMADDPELLEEFNTCRDDKKVKFYTFMKKYNERSALRLESASAQTR
jgi:hypothetical protein